MNSLEYGFNVELSLNYLVICQFIEEVVDSGVFDRMGYFLGEKGLIEYKYIEEEYY